MFCLYFWSSCVLTAEFQDLKDECSDLHRRIQANEVEIKMYFLFLAVICLIFGSSVHRHIELLNG